jgi:predicted O-methyltransferase YrrM
VDLIFGQEDFHPVQVRAEITALLERISAERLERVLEIGSAFGGTAFLFARVASPDATIVLVDQVFGRGRRLAVRQLSRRGQRIVCLRADSQFPATAARVATHFRGAPVDFLFIDADHSYHGVVTDFKTYSRLVRKGGLIAFHDIVSDHSKRFDRRTSASAGEVFRFWLELKSRPGLVTSEFVENPEQDGAGIGLVRWDPAAAGVS